MKGAQTGKPGQGEVAPGQRWTLRLSFQDDQLLAEEHVLQQQFRLAARQVQGCIQDEIMVVRPRPLTKMPFDSLNKGMQVVMREGKEWELYGLPFALGFQAMILPQDEVI